MAAYRLSISILVTCALVIMLGARPVADIAPRQGAVASSCPNGGCDGAKNKG